MTAFKITLLGAFLALSSQAFAQNYNRGTDPRAAGADVPLAQSQSVRPFYRAQALSTSTDRVRRTEILRLR